MDPGLEVRSPNKRDAEDPSLTLVFV